MINKSAASTGRAFDVSIKRERSASIGCAGLTRLQRCRQIQQFLFAYPGSLRSTFAHWERLRLLLPPQKPPTGRPCVDHRLMVEGMLWIVRTGSRLSRIARALGTMVDGGEPLLPLAQRRTMGTHLRGLASL